MEPMDLENEFVPQTEKLSGDQVLNKAGGYVYKVEDINRLRRFLCLGSEGGNYYTGEKELGIENAKCIQKMIDDGKGKAVVDEITEFSVQGRAAKQNPTIFALSLCARQDKDKKTKELAYKALPKVCRIPTHLFNFVEYSEKLSRGTGWGRAHRRAIGNWYLSHREEAMRLAMHVTKYRNRNGWTHKDLLRLSHPKPDCDKVAMIVKYIVKGINVAGQSYIEDENSINEDMLKLFNFLKSTEDIKSKTEDQDIISMIEQFGLVREHIPTNKLNSALIWEALLKNMPMTAMIRNLAKMTVIGLLDNESEATKTVTQRLSDETALKKARIHPFNVLTALHTYKKGKGEKGKLTWTPVRKIEEALEAAFYKSFKFVEPTGLRYLIALDVSGSMTWGGIIGNASITPREGSAAMSMVTARTEKNHEFVGFSTSLVNLPIRSDMDIDQVMKTVDSVPMGGTDCAQPMIWAKK